MIGLVGYDWEPHGVEVTTEEQPQIERHATDPGEFVWEMRASLAAAALATGRDLLITPEHSLHLLEIIESARKSQDTGRRIPLTSTFDLPILPR